MHCSICVIFKNKDFICLKTGFLYNDRFKFKGKINRRIIANSFSDYPSWINIY